MANTKSNVLTGKPAVSGSIYRGILDENLTIPTNATADLDTNFKCLGYVSEDGVKNSMAKDKEELKAWGGDAVLDINKTMDDKFTFTLLETLNDDVIKTVYGDDNVTITDATTTAPKAVSIAVNDDEKPLCAFVIEMVLPDGNPKRIVIPKGKIDEIGDIIYKDDEAVAYEVTIAAEKDSSGNTHYEYMTVGTATSGT
jgi:hypothetical protein